MNIQQPIVLKPEQREELLRFATKGVHSVRLANRARMILALDTSADHTPETLSNIAQHLNVSRQTLDNARRDFLAATDTAAFLQRKKRKTPPVPPKITGEVEARIIALACGQPPKGCARWTLKLLAERAVELDVLASVSGMTLCRLLKKRNLSPT
jgi:transposase